MQISRLLPTLACALPLAGADYTTYIGDSFSHHVAAIASDASGNTYATGSRAATRLQTDVFVSKIDPSGNVTLVATLSGKGSDEAHTIAVDSAGNIYVAGSTTSPDFPLLHPLQSVPSKPGFITITTTGFLVKMSPDGTVLYSTYFGGTAGPSSVNAVTADAAGNAYITGETFASDYPHTPGLPASAAVAGSGGSSAAFFAKISPAGKEILYAGGLAGNVRACGAGSTCFISELETLGVAIAVDPAGNAYIAGNTFGTGLPTTAGALLTQGIGAFVAKVNAGGNRNGIHHTAGSGK